LTIDEKFDPILICNFIQQITEDTSNINQLIYYQNSNMFIGAHESGILSAFSPGENGLVSLGMMKLSEKGLTKMRLHGSFLIVGSFLGVISVYNIDKSFEVIFVSSPFSYVRFF